MVQSPNEMTPDWAYVNVVGKNGDILLHNEDNILAENETFMQNLNNV